MKRHSGYGCFRYFERTNKRNSHVSQEFLQVSLTKLSKVISTSPLHVLQSVMTECQCVHVVLQDPSLVVCASHECLGLFFRADVECLIVNALEAAFHHCIFLLLCLNNALVQIDILHAHSLTIDHNIARNSLCCIVFHMLLIDQ